MKRRKFLTISGLNLLSLTGLNRLIESMSIINPAAIGVCPATLDTSFMCYGSTSYKCGDNEDAFVCEADLFACKRFVCNPQRGDFNCIHAFGCTDIFRCEGIDPPNDAQFNCKEAFSGCKPNTNFVCDDFACDNYTTPPSPPPPPPCDPPSVFTCAGNYNLRYTITPPEPEKYTLQNGGIKVKRKGMTLIELLVVISLVIFIAITLMLPAYERVRERAMEVVCVSNLHQIGQALLMYAEDHDGFIPPYCNCGGNPYEFELISFHSRQWRASFDPYIRDNSIFFCPKDPFAGLPPQKVPPHVRPIDHSITSYLSCPGFGPLWGKYLTSKDLFESGYFLTIDIYRNISLLPRDWLFAPIDEEGIFPINYEIIVQRLHNLNIFLIDENHFINEYEIPDGFIELFHDGSVDFHLFRPNKRYCYLYRQLETYYKPKRGE